MRKFFTLQRAVIRITFLGLIIFGSVNAHSQCSGTGVTICPDVTETFEMDKFTTTAIIYSAENKNYSIGGNGRETFTLTSNYFNIGNNIILVGGQITSGNNRISNTTKIEVFEFGNPVAICSYTGVMSGTCKAASFSGLSGKVVQFKFTFTKTGNGGVTFDNFGIDPSQTILPVNFISFDAKSENNGTNLTWKVADQIDVLRYDVERSSNGNNFSKIGEVAAADVTTYTFTDNQPAQGTVYYRVKNVDVDGKYKYSTIVSIRNGNAAIVLKAFPTPATNNVTLQHGTANAKSTIRISAQDGRQVATLRPAAGSMQTGIDLSAYAPGLYLISFDNGNGQVETLKVVKQ